MLHGDKFFDFSAIIGWKALTESVKLYGDTHEFTKLVQNLEGEDPEDAFSSVPYEKGFAFLYFLDRTVGREKWDKFIPHVCPPLPHYPSPLTYPPPSSWLTRMPLGAF